MLHYDWFVEGHCTVPMSLQYKILMSELYSRQTDKKGAINFKNQQISPKFWTKIYHKTREVWTAAVQTQAKYEPLLGLGKVTLNLLICFLPGLCIVALPRFRQKHKYHTVLREKLLCCYCISGLMRNRKYRQSHESACSLKVSSSNGGHYTNPSEPENLLKLAYF